MTLRETGRDATKNTRFEIIEVYRGLEIKRSDGVAGLELRGRRLEITRGQEGHCN